MGSVTDRQKAEDSREAVDRTNAPSQTGAAPEAQEGLPSADILDEMADAQTSFPDFQHFLALNIFVVGRQGRSRQRVTITTSLRHLEEDLRSVLPPEVRRQLRTRDYHIPQKESRREILESQPKRDPLVAICSCGKRDCEHLEVACRHFELVRRFADNTRQVLDDIHDRQHRLQEVYEAHSLATDRIRQLQGDRDDLAQKLTSAEAASERARTLESELFVREEELLQALIDAEQYARSQADLRAEIAQHQANYEQIMLEFSRQNEIPRDPLEPPETIDQRALGVFRSRFLLPTSRIPPEQKLEANAGADHHMTANARLVASRAARLDFVRQVGIDYRIPAKTGKVVLCPQIGELRIVVPRDGDANEVHVYTTAETQPQHQFAAYLFADEFGVEVQHN